MAEENKTNWLLWIVGGFILLLIWGNLSKKSACHPLNSTAITTSLPVASCAQPSSGDSFQSSIWTPVAGVTEPQPPVNVGSPLLPTAEMNRLKLTSPPPLRIQGPTNTYVNSAAPIFVPIHVSLPIDPIQPPPVPVTAPRPPIQPISTVRVCNGLGGPTDCQALAKLNSLCGGSGSPVCGYTYNPSPINVSIPRRAVL